MREAGIVVQDLDALARSMPAGQTFFARRDHHWTSAALELTAQKTAEAVIGLGRGYPKQATVDLQRETRNYGGSIADELQKHCQYSFPSSEQRVFYKAVTSGSGDLLGDEPIDIYAIGDSFSIDYFGFPQVVSALLKAPIQNMSINGGGCCSAFPALYASLGPQDHKPSILIWTSLNVLMGSNETREYKPTFYSAYHTSSPLATATVDTPNAQPTTMNVPLDKTARYYLRVTFTGKKTQNYSLTLHYSGAEEKVAVWRKDEAVKDRYTTSFYYELKPEQSTLESVRVTSDSGDGYQVSVFRYDRLP